MRDPETGLIIRTLDAVNRYIAEHIIKNNPNYDFYQALREAGYKSKYVQNYGAKIWQDVAVQDKIRSYTAKMQAKTELTVDKVLKDLNLAETALLDTEGKLPRGNVHAFLKVVELRGKYLAMWTENTNITDTQKQRELDDRERAEAEKIAAIRLREIVEQNNLKSKAG